MRMKEDAMNNGQTKPGYNLQIATEDQFVTGFALFPNPTDTLTLIPFFNSFLQRYVNLPSVAVADSGYGSEENYRFMDEAGMEAYVKYNRFHIEQHPPLQARSVPSGQLPLKRRRGLIRLSHGTAHDPHRFLPLQDGKRLPQRKCTIPRTELQGLSSAMPLL